MILRKRFVFNFHYNYGADAIIRSLYSGIFKLPLTIFTNPEGYTKTTFAYLDINRTYSATF